MMKRSKPLMIAIALFAASIPECVVAQENESAQSFYPRQGFMLAGYGAAGYSADVSNSDTPGNFGVVFAPIMLFQVSDRVLFEGEFEFELEEGVTSTDLEYAQIDLDLSNNFQGIAGKFLLPFNIFSERSHPTWINPFVSKPPLYGGHGSTGPVDPLLPILTDIGVEIKGVYPLGNFQTLTTEVFVTQGPKLAVDEHAADGDASATGKSETQLAASRASGLLKSGELADVSIGANTDDNNTDKMVGGRIGYGIAPYFEVNASGMTGAYDDAGDLRFSALGLHLESRYRNFTLHGEFIKTYQEFFEGEGHGGDIVGKTGSASTSGTQAAGVKETLSRSGYYLQFAYRHGKWQPIARWTQILEGKVDGKSATESGQQFGVGLVHWLEPSIALKAEYLVNTEDADIDNNQLAVQIAFGF